MGMVVTFHVRKGKGRTTVSLERTLSQLLSIRLCGKVDMAVVSRWCQEQLNADPGAFERDASQRLASKAAVAVAPKEVQEKWADTLLDEMLTNPLRKKRRRDRKRGPG